MRKLYPLLLFLLPLTALAQVDTVVVRPDSSFQSLFQRKLTDRRTNIRFDLLNRGQVRDVVFHLARIREIESGKMLYALRIDQAQTISISSDMPLSEGSYLDEDELPLFIHYLDTLKNHIMPSARPMDMYSELRYHTRSGLLLECFTAANRWRSILYYRVGDSSVSTQFNQVERLDEILTIVRNVQREIGIYRKAEQKTG